MAVTTPTIYRSTDTGAPIVNAARGSIVNLLKKCLVNGYGSTRATATITSNGTNVSNNDTVTIDGTVYTFKTALTPAAGEVLIGASAAASLTNLVAAMHALGTSGTTYGAGTQHQTNVQATNVTSTVITLTAFTGGTGGNSLALSKSAATLTVSGANFTGGAGSDTISSVGWALSFNTDISKGVFRAPSGGRRFYYRVLDDNSLTGIGRDFVVRGAESMSDVDTATVFFPTVAQLSDANNSARKSTTSDFTNRAWTVWADDRTVYVWIATGDSGSLSCACGFGDFYSFVTSDSYNGFCATRGATTAGTATSANGAFDNVCFTGNIATTTNLYFARKAIGTGGSEGGTKFVDVCPNQGAAAFGGPAGILVYPNTADSKLHMSRVYVIDTTNGTLRGWLRGLYAAKHAASNFVELDTATGTTLADVSFSGKSFVVGPKGFTAAPTSTPYFLETSATVEISA